MVRWGGQEAVDLWMKERCERFGESSASSLYNDFWTWLVAMRFSRPEIKLAHKLGRGEFGLALRHAGIQHRRKNGLTYYLGLSVPITAMI